MDRRQTGSYPETGLAEINDDLREADFWTLLQRQLLSKRAQLAE